LRNLVGRRTTPAKEDNEMSRRSIWLLVLTIVVVGLIAWALPVPGEMVEETVLVGTVVAVGWNDEGDVIAIDIATAEGESIAVDLEGDGLQLFSYIDETVEITGTVYEDDDGWMRVKVHSIRALPESV
jgi:hypothetical protein